MRGKCNGRCVVGAAVAIFFGSLFLLVLIDGIRTQWGGSMGTAFGRYIVALILFAIAKCAKWWAMTCPHCVDESSAAPAKKGKK